MSNSGNTDAVTTCCPGEWLLYIKLKAEKSRHSARFHPYTSGRVPQYERLHRTQSAPSLVLTEDVPLNAHQICELLDGFAQDFSDLSTNLDRCLRNVGIKFPKISQNIESASQLDRKLFTSVVKYVVSIMKSVKHKILGMEIGPFHIEMLTNLRDQLKKAAASGPPVIDSSQCSQFGPVPNVPGYARDWSDYLYGNVDIHAADMRELLFDYAGDWLDLSINLNNYDKRLDSKISEIDDNIKALLDTDEQSKNMILGGIENAISRIEAMNVKIATRVIIEHLKLFTTVLDSLNNAAGPSS